MPKGTIRRLIGDRGYGFIKAEEEEDLFFHRNELEEVDYDSLTEGKQVEFEIGRGRNGRPMAVRVKLAEPEGVLMQAYCMKCRAKREMKDAKSITMKNGKPATQGVCPTCGTKMFRIGKA